MPDIEPLLTRWQSAGAMDAEAAARIRALERNDAAQADGGGPGGLGWLGVTALFCAAILIACGAILFVSAHWLQFTPGARFALALALVAVFHVAGGIARASFPGLSIALHAAGTFSTGAAIMVVGEIFTLEYHGPIAVLLWALAALAGWMLLRDQAQQTLALLLVPAWIFCELGVRTSGYIGDGAYMGRLAFVWGILYITFFLRLTAQGRRRHSVRRGRGCRGGRHLPDALQLGLFFSEPELYSLWHARLGLGCHRRSAADCRRIPRAQRAYSHCRRHRIL